MLSRAIAIVANAFKDVKDKGGRPYILHCLRVMDKMPQEDEDLLCIAVLHDLIEDTNYTLEDLRREGFSDRVVQGVNLLTKLGTMNYDDYIHQISQNINATLVKLADLEDNSDITRLKGLREKDFIRMQKYHKSYLLLKAAKIKLTR